MNKPIHNLKDDLGVALGASHNIGAGGVIPFVKYSCGYINIEGISTKRCAQYCRRTLRAGGHPDYR